MAQMVQSSEQMSVSLMVMNLDHLKAAQKVIWMVLPMDSDLAHMLAMWWVMSLDHLSAVLKAMQMGLSMERG